MKKIFLSFVLICTMSLTGLFAAGQSEKLSGSLTVYSPNGAEITGPIVSLYNKKYPDIKVELIKAGTGELLSRLRAEKNNPAADVMWGGSTILFESAADLFAPYKAANDKDMIKQDPNNKWHPFSILCQPILVNTRRLKPAEYPKTIKELTDAVWKKRGTIALADPNKSGTGFTIVSGISNAYGWGFVKELVKNSTITPGSDAMFKAVLDGEVPVGFINEDLGIKWEQAGQPVKMIYASDVVTVQIDAYGLVKGAPHSKLGKTFIDFLGSKPVAEIARNTIKRRSARKDVSPPQGLPALGDLKLYPESEPRTVVTAKFNKILKELGK